MKSHTRLITGDSPGRTTELTCFYAGPEDAAKKVYLQAATHAGEQPGIMILHHLLDLLSEAEGQGRLKARFTVFPMVNPLGMGNLRFGQHQGRYDELSGVNFNRDWPDMYVQLRESLNSGLGKNEDQNKQYVLNQTRDWLQRRTVHTARDQMRQIVLEESFDADYVFDLHCDSDALVHIFAVPQIANEMKELGDWVGSSATLLAENSGGGSFDEVWPRLWIDLAREHPGFPVPRPVKACTLEYRGEFDVFDDLNADDARNLFSYFQAEGLIEGDPGNKPSISPDPLDLRGTEFLRATEPGLLAYKVQLGDRVAKGDTVADLIRLHGEQAFRERVPICAGTDGIIISRCVEKYVWPGEPIVKIVGSEILQSDSDRLLSD